MRNPVHEYLNRPYCNSPLMWRWLVVFIFPFFILNFHLVFSSTKTGVIKCLPNGRCTCPVDPLTERYPDPRDPACERYYLCHLGHAYLRRCEVRKAFHPIKGECLPRQTIPEYICQFGKQN